MRDVATQFAARLGPQRRLSTAFRETWGSTGAAAGDGDRGAIFRWLRADVAEWIESVVIAVEAVERVIVRVAVRAGVPIANPQFGTQWEGPIGEASDTLALLAVSLSDSLRPPARRMSTGHVIS